MSRLNFTSDYTVTCTPEILRGLASLGHEPFTGYGFDRISEAARNKIRELCVAPEAEVYFLSGGTQANEVVINTWLAPYQGVIAATTGHVALHEAGAIEHGGHKVLAIPGVDAKVTPDGIRNFVENYYADDNHEHMVMPGLVYISNPSEYGTVYSLKELEELSAVCHEFQLPLYMDGARLAYALASDGYDLTLPDIARLCDAFYIGGTKCGALYGEAVVFPKKNTIPHFFTMVKQNGALFAKGWGAGSQFLTLMSDGLYEKLGRNAIEKANEIRKALDEKGYTQYIRNTTNQIFIVLTKEKNEELAESVELGFWENLPDGHVVMRIATSWATTEEDVKALIELL